MASTITNDLSQDLEIDKRLAKAVAAMAKLSKDAQDNSNLTVRT